VKTRRFIGVTTNGHVHVSVPEAARTLDYLAPQNTPFRPPMMSIVAVLSITIGCLGSFIYLFIELFSWISSPMLLPGPAQPSDLPILFSLEFHLCWAAMVWLFFAGIQVFAWNRRGRLNPYNMFVYYVAAKFILTLSYCVLQLVSIARLFGGTFPAQVWNHDVLFWLTTMGGYPLVILFVLLSKPAREYYKTPFEPAESWSS
jgi:hypothetical protein